MSNLETLKTYDGKVYFRGLCFSSYKDLTSQIDDANEIMTEIIGKVKQLAAATPIAITPSGKTPLSYINEMVDDLMDDYFNACQKWQLLVCAESIVNDFAIRDNISKEDAFKKCYIDKWADLRNEINKTKL